MKLLIDADYTVYKCCAAAEGEIDFGNDVILVTSLFSEAYSCVKRDLDRISEKFGAFSEMILFFSDSCNFRKDIVPTYKGNRQRKKPCGYKRVIGKLKTEFKVITMPWLEADDSLGIYATQNPGNVIVSPDKDMKQIPGMLFNLEESTLINKTDGAKWHLLQSASGDNTDGYSGIPGVGIKRATKFFVEKGWSWKTLVEEYEAKGLTEKDALENARLAKILTAEDYDFERREPILWNPDSDYTIND